MPRPTESTESQYVSLTGIKYLDSLLSGTKWADDGMGVSLTYSFISLGNSYFASDYSAANEYEAGYELTATQRAAATAALSTWSAVADITFRQTSDNWANVGDIRFGGYALMDADAAAWAYTPGDTPNAGDIWIGPNTDDPSPVKGTYDFMTFVHEIGHALGLKHPFAPTPGNATTMDPALDDITHTIMSYNNSYSYHPTTPMLLDILAIQNLYGANTMWATGNTVYSWAANQSVFETIWDAGGVDAIDGSNQAAAVRIDLNEGAFSKIGKVFSDPDGADFNEGLAIAFGAKIENAVGSGFNDTLIGNALDNLLNGMAGADTMTGGAGNDTYIVDDAGDVVVETGSSRSEIDSVFSYIDYTLGDNVENLTLSGAANLTATGNALNNELTGNAGDNVLDGGLGADIMTGGAGNDIYIVDNVADVVIETRALYSEIDTVQSSISYTLGKNVEDLILTGTADINAIGNALGNILVGNSGNNQLNGGAGIDAMIGGDGNDAYALDQGAELGLIREYVNQGNDTLITLFNANAQYNLIDLSQSNLQNVENVTVLGAGAFTIAGNSLNNVLIGNADANFINGGQGADIMTGGAGNDTYIIDNVNDAVIETGASLTEIDTVYSYIDYTLGDNLENLNLAGEANLNATGNARNNAIYGNAGNNILDGGLGADYMAGGFGNDTYIVDNTGDVIFEDWDLVGVVDTVRASVSYTLSANLENLVLTGTADTNAIGNGQNNVLTGNDGNNQLNGGAGVDTMIGGKGNDAYALDQSAELALIQENANEGNDTLITLFNATALNSTIDLNIANLKNVENLSVSGAGAFTLAGNELNNTLIGNADANFINGGKGIDIMQGGGGNDTYIVDNILDQVIETDATPSQIDTVYSYVSHYLSANVENLTLVGSTDLTGVGNALNNVIYGNDGNNQINGGLGIDTMIGGKGNDDYALDQFAELALIQENASEGVDRLLIQYNANAQTSIVDLNLTNLQQVENVMLLGGGEFTLAGNSLNNVLVGNAAANFINGGQGADTMTGGAGNDTYIVDNINDAVIETGVSLSEIDTVYSYIDYTLGTNVENLTLAGGSHLHANGNALNNVIYGNTGNNILDGGAGADFMAGGTGNDTYIVDNVSDVISETSTLANEIDTVRASVSYTLSANLENLILTGTAGTNAIGNDQNNLLTGNDGNNQLNGGAGVDTMIGGKGSDAYALDQYAELALIQENANEGSDTLITLFNATSTSTIIDLNIGNLQNVENVTVLGAGAFTLAGNGLDNILVGNADANFINGGKGADTMTGGGGNDTYIVDNIGDVVTETGTSVSEIDSVYSYVDYTLGANLEILNLVGSASKGTGNGLNNSIYGNDTNNVLDGGAGTDTLTGGAGADTFVFSSLTDMGVGASRDVITDFSSLQGDKIDLTKFDANLLQGGMDGFTFIGANDFTGAGQLRFVDHVLSGNVSGNAGADFEIQLVGVNSFSANDLVA
ncbi:M10 family metallopeptidase C-terminal domain-containing protein [Pseudomonas sp. OB66]|uniref:M10 family metallopeptidase C-terminal domain-containing protein n=1 Tax=Pseudomonas sp. OB66 TaxID=3137730 RepID=UPI00311DDCD7